MSRLNKFILSIFTVLVVAGITNAAQACSVNISSGATSVCAGSAITFNGIIIGATNTTTYQWKKNGVAMTGTGNNGHINAPGNGSFTFTTTGFSNGDVITCYITQPSASFFTTSSGITITVHTTAAITGATMVGTGGTITLTDATAGGSWTSSRASVATVGSSTGMIYGVAAGAATITYNAGGCYATATVNDITVSVITGATTVCSGSATTLSDATTSGVWSSSATGVASVGSAGLVTGVSAGAATISYKVYGATKTAVVTVNMKPAAITGSSIVGIGGIVTLSDATAGGSWTSSRPAVATVCASCGGVTGIANGTSTITYTYTVNGCYSSTTVNVVSIPAITGTAALCNGASATFTDATAGGAWSTGNAFIATVGSTGVVTGIAPGFTTIAYKVYGATVTTTVTVNAIPSAITGAGTIGAGGITTLTDATTGGTWTSAPAAVATIGSATGTATGVAAGTATITYNVSGCYTTSVMQVISIAAITGATTVCQGSTATLADAAAGGAWSSSNTAVAAAGSATGIITGVAAGTAIISYRLGTSAATAIVTINALPAAGAITGAGTVSTGATTTLSDATAGGVWSSSDSYVASVAGGVVTGVSTGSAIITYAVTNGCGATKALAAISVASPAGPSCSPIITTVAGDHVSGFSGNGGVATAASLNNPYGVAADASGNIYIADKGNNCIRKVNTSGIISTFAGNGVAGYTGDNGAATAAKLNSPGGVACDAGGNVYIADQVNNCIRKVNTSGVICTYAGNSIAGYNGDGGQATAAEFNQPSNVAADASGNLYIVDFNNSAIRKVATSGIICTVAGTGTPGFSGDGGAATLAKLYHPTMVACDASGNIYIDDENNDRIRKVNASGMICTIAGTGIDGFSGDGGPATAAQLNETWGVCVDRAGNVYIADQVNERIRIINTSGIINTYCGTGVRGPEGDGGPATAGHLYNPYGICVDASGNLFIADNINQCIRKISVCSLTVSAVTGASNVCTGTAITLADAATGGTWSSSNTSVASVNPATGAVTGVSAGTVTITYTMGATAIVTLTVLPSPSVTGTITAPTCFGYNNGNIDITATGGSTSGTWLYYNYSWSTGATTDGLWGVGANTYTVTATDPNGCSGSAIFNVTAPAAMIGSGVTSDVTVYGGSDGFIDYSVTGGTGAYTYEWNTAATTENISSLTAASYFVTATDVNGCQVTDFYTIAQPVCTSGRHSSPSGDTTDNSAPVAENIINVARANAYPNPFVSSTNITFSMTADGHTVVEVYNAISGEKVETPFSDDTKAGTEYSCALSGANLASGVYIYKISSGSSDYIGKVVLAK